MRFIKMGSGGYDLTEYGEYLDAHRSDLERLVSGDDLLRIERNGLFGPGSFHDARLRSLWLEADEVGGDAKVECVLKGPYSDRFFDLTYVGVTSWTLSIPGPDIDALVHEVSLSDGGLIHEIWFDQGFRVRIVCDGIHFVERFVSEIQ